MKIFSVHTYFLEMQVWTHHFPDIYQGENNVTKTTFSFYLQSLTTSTDSFSTRMTNVQLFFENDAHVVGLIKPASKNHKLQDFSSNMFYISFGLLKRFIKNAANRDCLTLLDLQTINKMCIE